MKLLMENWRGFVAGTAKTQSYGDLYLFEGDTVQKVSFYERFIALNENDDDFQIFLEQWETSVNYIFNNLEEQTGIEQVDDAILKASTQAYALLSRGKEKAHTAVLNLAKKAKARGGFGKVGAIALTALVAAATAFAISKAMEAGADESAISNIANAASEIVPNVGQVAQDSGTAVDQLNQMVDGAAQQLNQVDSPAAQRAADALEALEGAGGSGEISHDPETASYYLRSSHSSGPAQDAYNLANKALQALGSGDKSAHMDAVNQLIDMSMDSSTPGASMDALRDYDMSSLGNKKGIMDLMDVIQSAGLEATGAADTAAEPRFGGGRGIQRALSKLKR